MKPLEFDLDARRWFQRWEAMQNAYLPQRLYRFDLLFEFAHLPREAEVQIVDLGCGPGSLAFRALEHYPNARILAVDFDRVLLTIGRRLAETTIDRIRFERADFRRPEWWAPHKETFDLAVSATTFHWLSRESLTATYRNVYRALKPGGCLMNSDHFAADDPDRRVRYQERLEAKREIAFRETKADDWRGFWDGLAAELGVTDLEPLRGESGLWEGTEEGLPRRFHVETLRACGFEAVEFLWQDLGEAVLAARKPMP